MTLLISNTLTSNKEEFVPLNGKNVTMYVCGVTPYDEVHLGHARAYVTFDFIRRHLEHSGFSVKFIQNFTDVDDKIIKRAAERNTTPSALAETFINDYFTQMDRLNVKRADAYPRVTSSVPQIISFIETLVKNGSAYSVKSGDVYFSVQKFPGYGKLSKRKPEDLKAGVRVEIGEEKDDPLDFALWKATKDNEPAEVSWQSPWGKGRPGWHIECSVMATNALGASIDIHGGGQDLIFPHHENEIAQSEAATGKPFAKYWIHNGFVTINKEKMSKSLGNFFTLREIFEKYSPRVVRYFLLSRHYKSPLDFSDDKLKAAQSALEGIDDVLRKLSLVPYAPPTPAHLHSLDSALDEGVVAEFNAAMDDDFNTEKALAVLHNLKREAASAISQKSPGTLYKYFNTLKTLLSDNLGVGQAAQTEVPANVLELKAQREAARRGKDWKKSDELRAKLSSLKFKVEDNPDGTSTLLPL